MINSFRGKYGFLSNMYDAPVFYNGMLFKSSEAAYQAQKTLDRHEQFSFTKLSGPEAKKKGKTVHIRADWNEVKIRIMYDIVFAKFSQNPILAQRLIDTSPQELIEGNTWGDTFWGQVNSKGHNWLGKILMEVRLDLIILQTYKNEFFRRNKGGDDMIKTPRICPKCGGKKWIVTAHVTQDWEVNEYGEYIKTICDCVETTHSPDENDVWCCSKCDAEYDNNTEKPTKIPKSKHECMCIDCPFCKQYFTNGRYCNHKNQKYIKKYFKNNNMKKMPGFIGFLKVNSEFPIKRTPKWCPRLEEEKEK